MPSSFAEELSVKVVKGGFSSLVSEWCMEPIHHTKHLTSPRGQARVLTLLVLVAESPGLVGAGGSGGTVHPVQLAVLPASDTEKVPQDIALLLAVELGHVLVGSHGERLPGLPGKKNTLWQRGNEMFVENARL